MYQSIKTGKGHKVATRHSFLHFSSLTKHCQLPKFNSMLVLFSIREVESDKMLLCRSRPIRSLQFLTRCSWEPLICPFSRDLSGEIGHKCSLVILWTSTVLSDTHFKMFLETLGSWLSINPQTLAHRSVWGSMMIPVSTLLLDHSNSMRFKKFVLIKECERVLTQTVEMVPLPWMVGNLPATFIKESNVWVTFASSIFRFLYRQWITEEEVGTCLPLF